MLDRIKQFNQDAEQLFEDLSNVKLTTKQIVVLQDVVKNLDNISSELDAMIDLAKENNSDYKFKFLHN